jgi:hypothetical protein
MMCNESAFRTRGLIVVRKLVFAQILPIMLILILLLVSACAFWEEEAPLPPEVSGPQFNVPTFQLDSLPPLPPFAGLAEEIYTRYSPEAFVDALRPAAGYGKLYPYIGKVLYDNFFHGASMRYGLVDEQGRIVVDPVYAEAYYTEGGPEAGAEYLVLSYPMDKNDTEAQEAAIAMDFFSVRKHYQFAKADGSWVSPLYYGDEARLFADRVIVQVNSDNPEEVWSGRGVKYKLYDLQANLLSEGEGRLANFCDGLGLVQNVIEENGEYLNAYSYIDKNGNTIIEGPFSSATDFEDGKALVTLEKETFFAVIDAGGNYVVEPKRIGDMVYLYSGNKYLTFRDKYRQGMIDRMGNIVLPAVYEYISHSYEGDNYLLAAQKPNQEYDIVDLRSGQIAPADANLANFNVLQNGWLLAQTQTQVLPDGSYATPDQYLIRGEERYEFLAKDYWNCYIRYVKDNIFAICENEYPDGYNVYFFDTLQGEIIKTCPGWYYSSADQTPQGAVYYLHNDYKQKNLVLAEDFEPLFTSGDMAGAAGFSEIRYLKDGLFTARTDRFSGLIRSDGSWLIRVEAQYND